jgi:hypothetical protein
LGVVHLDILKGLLGLECATATRPHCHCVKGNPGFSEFSTYVCVECGKTVVPEGGERIEIHDDNGTWYEFEDSRGPNRNQFHIVCPH